MCISHNKPAFTLLWLTLELFPVWNQGTSPGSPYQELGRDLGHDHPLASHLPATFLQKKKREEVVFSPSTLIITCSPLNSQDRALLPADLYPSQASYSNKSISYLKNKNKTCMMSLHLNNRTIKYQFITKIKIKYSLIINYPFSLVRFIKKRTN